jgi:hypothetical protein
MTDNPHAFKQKHQKGHTPGLSPTISALLSATRGAPAQTYVACTQRSRARTLKRSQAHTHMT